jgi:hypothetical protein
MIYDWSKNSPAKTRTLDLRVPLRAYYYLLEICDPCKDELGEIKKLRPIEPPNPNGKTKEEKKGFTEEDQEELCKTVKRFLEQPWWFCFACRKYNFFVLMTKSTYLCPTICSHCPTTVVTG